MGQKGWVIESQLDPQLPPAGFEMIQFCDAGTYAILGPVVHGKGEVGRALIVAEPAVHRGEAAAEGGPAHDERLRGAEGDLMGAKDSEDPTPRDLGQASASAQV